ncbi:MAG: hypothetical protein AAF170_01635 [Bacteroidota bacterium]
MRLSRLPFGAQSALALSVLTLCLASGCGTSAPAAVDINPQLVGVWIIEGGATYTITAAGDTYELSVVDSDGEVFEVTSLTWDGSVLAWTYFVPSSGANVREETTHIGENRIDVGWVNSEGDIGTDILNRVQ